MSAFAARVAALAGVPQARLTRLAGGDLSEVLLVERPDGRRLVAKGGRACGTEAAMLRALQGAGVPAPGVEAEHDGVLFLEHVANDGLLNLRAWASIGTHLKRLHAASGERYGWPVHYSLGTVLLDNRERDDWAGFWGEQRLVSTASLVDRPIRERVEKLAQRVNELIPARSRPATATCGAATSSCSAAYSRPSSILLAIMAIPRWT